MGLGYSDRVVPRGSGIMLLNGSGEMLDEAIRHADTTALSGLLATAAGKTRGERDGEGGRHSVLFYSPLAFRCVFFGGRGRVWILSSALTG